MDELLLAILYALGELILEALGELVAEACVAAVTRIFRDLASDIEAMHLVPAAIGYLLLGGLFGSVSVLLYPHWLFHPSRFHGISLLISPLLTGIVMWQVGGILRRREKQTVPIESFGCGFIFALGWALVRFICVRT